MIFNGKTNVTEGAGDIPMAEFNTSRAMSWPGSIILEIGDPVQSGVKKLVPGDRVLLTRLLYCHKTKIFIIEYFKPKTTYLDREKCLD